MKIGVVREVRPRETRVAATPSTAARLMKLGCDVAVETGAGVAAGFADRQYAESGATVGTRDEVLRGADLVLGVNAPTLDQLDLLTPGATVVGLLGPTQSPELLAELARRGVTAIAMDAVPRISRAQSMDVLSSMANVAGYRAVVEAAHEFGRMFTGQATAAGKMPPARVFVVGAGVAGLAAIGAASAMGAVVRAFDVRPEVAEQVESLGGQFVTVDFESEVSTDGYAKQMTAGQEAATAEMYDAEARAADIVITTALIPGRPAPLLIGADTVAHMRSGSVVVDLAAAYGGNVAGTEADQRVITEYGVTILGYTDLPGRLATQASELYGTNLVSLVKTLVPDGDGQMVLDLDDVVLRSMTVVHAGEVTWPPPPVAVSAVPAPVPAPAAPTKHRSTSGRSSVASRSGVAVGAASVFALVAICPPSLQARLMVFALAVVIGYYVIGHVHHALHTPLMSVTNAISGIVVVGALLSLANDDELIVALAASATLLASINVFGGFAVTRRMLGLFVRS
ncbi:Re/Si-specific NAD(P)(+) transhydrogenase subunit alpha [Nocardioides sp. LMS-CY]|uniref:Re/Si-specific NAD(P)(+) transhydrogenase subunit alpha n=1 Tax=Nocardioides sp. (strain LMS-CY) TaxID=2840457 RepID=UPI001C001F7F|nr:Re/Si-specific NAD(P)(+) transhydrogenase subunit alpha [Nocardioides sp. LMS-CY]QWF20488.1 Re/Si-specific NAD(P)(+) transhydrogenase subunit alpha [Nocardioides sp. LMS-CY]